MIKRKTTLRTSKWSDAFHIDDPRFHLIYISQIDWNLPLTQNAGKKAIRKLDDVEWNPIKQKLKTNDHQYYYASYAGLMQLEFGFIDMEISFI